jgi:group I intron endonuclease
MGAWGVVYVATNTLTGEQYVGQTKQPPHVRFRAHEVSSRSPKTEFHRAIAAIGYDKFCFEVVVSSLTREALNEAEKTLIADWQPVYNATRGGAGRPRTVSDTERMRMSESAKLRWSNPEWRDKTVASIRKAAASEAYKALGRGLGKTGAGAKARWGNHTPTPSTPKNRSASISASWADPDIRARRVAGLTKANSRPEVRAKRSMARRRQVMPANAIAASARKKWKPVYCPELQTTFLSRLAAAEYIGVGKTAISEALRHTRKVAGKYTLREVHHQL